MKPLFIPLKREHFEAFASGVKTEEFRPFGPRWNTRTCFHGRPVVLSLGYGKANRLSGVVTGLRISRAESARPEYVACYGNAGGSVACIRIEIGGVA